MNKTGFTLIELMIGAVVLVTALLGLLGVFTGCFGLNETARNLTIAINGSQQRLEEMRRHTLANFDSIVGDCSPGGSVGNTFTINNWLPAAEQGAVIYILNPQTGAILNTSPAANPGLTLYEVRITVCWRQRGGRIIGEDNGTGAGGIALDGVLNGSEDVDGNNMLDSPAQIITLMGQR